MKRWLMMAAAGVTIAATAPELAHYLASRRQYGATPSRSGTEAIIVLGCPSNPDGSLHPLQRWRADVAVRTWSPAVDIVVFTGRTPGITGGSEASVMASYASTRGIPIDDIVLEEEALNTWQNLQFSAPLVMHCDVVRLVSDPMHAWRARQFLLRQNPSLAAKLAPALDYRPFERWWWKAERLVYESVARYRDWRRRRLPTA